MTTSLYLGAENIALTQAQKDAFRATLSQIGPPMHPSTAELMHWRGRLDGNATIMRSQFNDADLTTAGLRQLLATALGVSVTQIKSTTSSQTFGTIPSTIVLMSIGAVNQMRFILFGGVGATIQQSNNEALAYIKVNGAAWGDS
jgi:hypothetical protein